MNMDFRDYWIKTGSQEQIEKYISEHRVNAADFDYVKTNASETTSPGEITRTIKPALYLYQAGYLTVRKSKTGKTYYFTYPNNEVRAAMTRLVNDNFFSDEDIKDELMESFENSLKSHDYVNVFVTINRLFKLTAHQDYDAVEARKDLHQLECFYRNTFYVALYIAKFLVTVEPQSSDGQADIRVRYNGIDYIFEMKVSQSGTESNIRKKLKEAIDQMHDNDYLGQYENPVDIAISIDSVNHCIAMAAVMNDVYAITEKKKDGTPQTFERITDTLTFLGSFRNDACQ
ncbi:MAG: PD-(D/E)XK nuclease domain-containing protein [Desulfovibrio sp.]|jgi:hypothetical protein|nr:PD-(D/E)XK nuclease domain-containing protein [Desulfovibrio sp.]